MDTLLATVVVAGTKTLVPMLGVGTFAKMTKPLRRDEKTPYGKSVVYDTPYATGDYENFDKYPTDQHMHNRNMKPYFKTKVGALYSASSYVPAYLKDSNRTVKGTKEEEDAKAVSINGIGENSTLQVMNDHVILKDRYIRGDLVMNDWGAQMGRMDFKRGKHYRQTQHTPHRLLISLRSSATYAIFKQKHYNLSDSEARRILGRNAEIRLRNDMQPGWKIDGKGAMRANQFAQSVKFSSNVTATVTQISKHVTRNGVEFAPRDYYWVVDFNTTAQSGYTIEDIAGFGKADTLSETHSFTQLKEVRFNGTSEKRTPAMQYSTLQEAIADLESLGIGFEVEVEKTLAWPADRSPMYASNFPYRGMTKKTMQEPYAKRQKGGDAPRVLRSEWHPALIDHMSSKSDDYIFA
ncbi:hypothetical protein DIPPA_28750 [Diplonema papillatum]|nr:hypothetical protein DIPPA_28750 [Diplonema papillatum]